MVEIAGERVGNLRFSHSGFAVNALSLLMEAYVDHPDPDDRENMTLQFYVNLPQQHFPEVLAVSTF